MRIPAANEPARFLEYARTHMERMGSKYGGWVFLPMLLTRSSIVYSVGLGVDISWDLELIERTGVAVHGFDDTPTSNRKFALWEKQKICGHNSSKLAGTCASRGFHRHPWLLAADDGPVEMALPRGHSASFADVRTGGRQGFRNSTHTYKAQARTIGAIMASLNHTRIDVLKLDIESSELDLFNALLLARGDTPPVSRLPVCQLLVEWHVRLSPRGYEAKAQAGLALESLGFTLLLNAVHADSADDAFYVNSRFCPADYLNRTRVWAQSLREGPILRA